VSENLLDLVEDRRRQSAARLDTERQAILGQYFTPVTVATYMAGLISQTPKQVRLLDAGAGIGILFAAAVDALCRHSQPPQSIHIVAYELDANLAKLAGHTLEECTRFARAFGITVTGEIRNQDFLADCARVLGKDLFFQPDDALSFDLAILNPPYRKISVGSPERTALRRLGIETTNLYTGFLACALRTLVVGGQLVAITPRSFCNGSYFRSFRTDLLCRTALTHLHVFARRNDTFRDDAVLQETLIVRAVVGETPRNDVSVAHLEMPPQAGHAHTMAFSQIVHPDDPERFLHIPEQAAAPSSFPFSTSLSALGLSVSTGKVVDFRVAKFLRMDPTNEIMPLLYPIHCIDGDIQWPIIGIKKPNALYSAPETNSMSITNGEYVLVKRFSAKEQPRRIIPALYEAHWFPEANSFGLGLENHLNYFHHNGSGLDKHLARGLAIFLSGAAVDTYFRQFSGHTQINATNLRNLPYPTMAQLIALGERMGNTFPDTQTIERWIAEMSQ
jgi:adenine-specific DNA-methyltransferase